MCARLWSNPAELRHHVNISSSIAFINSSNATVLHSVCCWLHLQQKCHKRRCVGFSGAGKSLRSCSWGPPKAWRHRWGTPATQANHREGGVYGGWGGGATPSTSYHLARVPSVLRGAVLHQAVLVQVLAAAVRAAEGVAVWHWTGTQANTLVKLRY